MTYVLSKAREGYDERLDLFKAPPVETAMQQLYVKEYRPIGQISHGSTIEFDVQNNSSDYIILKDISLMLKVKIVDKDNKTVTAVNHVTFVNLCGASLFRQVDVAIQQQVVSSSVGPNYPYKAMLDTLLYTGKNDQLTWLALAGFSKDTAGNVGDYEPNTTANGGLSTRFAKTSAGRSVWYKTKLFVDILKQDRFLLNGLPLNVKLYPSLDKFVLLYKNLPAPKLYSAVIEDASLLVPHVKVNPTILTDHGEDIKKEMALYPFKRSEIKTYNITKGSQNWTVDNIFQDSIPNKLVLIFVDSKSYIGDNTKNPFEMKHFSLNYLDFQINGQSSGSEVLLPDFATNRYDNCFSRLFESMPTDQKEPPNISYYEYKEGNCIFVFDLNQNKNPLFTKPLRRGQTRLTAKFSTALPDDVTAIAYGSFESVMKVDESRNVVVES